MLLPTSLSAVYWLVLLAAEVQGRVLHDRQVPGERDWTWAVVGYSEANCKGDIIANWRGNKDVPACIKLNTTTSIAGGSGSTNVVNLWEDTECKQPAGDLIAAGQDSNSFPCYNTVIRAFSVGSVILGQNDIGGSGVSTMAQLDSASV